MLQKKVIIMLPEALCMAINHKVVRSLAGLVTCLVLALATGSAQEAQFKPSKEMASELFSSGKYSEAIRHFSALSDDFPADPLYKYYTGVCMVMTGMDPIESSALLNRAMSESNRLRPVPEDVMFYLGRSYQQSGSFSEATGFYNRFKEKASKKEIRNLDVDRYLKECSSGSGSIVGLDAIGEGAAVIVADAGVADVEENVKVAQVPDKVIVQERDTVIDPGYDAMARDALLMQFRADSVIRLADRYRSRLKELSGNEKLTVEQKILQLERLGFEYQSEADKKFAMVSGTTDLRVLSLNRSELITADNLSGEEAVVITADSASNNKMATSGGEAALNTVGGDTIPLVVEKSPVLVLFGDDYGNDTEIRVNPDLPGGLVYRIQVAAFRNPVQQELFKSLGPVYGIRADNSDITFYFIGLFRSKSDADRALGKVRNKGFNDAFVVPVLDGTKISLERAASVEPEWKDKTLEGSGFAGNLTADTEPSQPQTLVYRIEVKKVTKPLPESEISNIKRVAGNRPFDIISTDDKKIVYLIGKFITFESAATYSDLLFRNGMKEVKVVAYLGNTEIPIEKAKELFELYYNKQAL